MNKNERRCPTKKSLSCKMLVLTKKRAVSLAVVGSVQGRSCRSALQVWMSETLGGGVPTLGTPTL